MFRLYRFSPIMNRGKLQEAVVHVARSTSEMVRRIVGVVPPIHSLTVFAHYPDEFQFLSREVLRMGSLFNENNGPRVALHEPIRVGQHTITHLRIRVPDPHRMQVGCNDFDIADYHSFRKKHIPAHSENMRIIPRGSYEMIEIFHPDYDVLAYVVSGGNGGPV